MTSSNGVNDLNKARYTITPVACRWAGALFEVSKTFGQEQYGQKHQKSKVWRKDGRTNGWTDKAGCRVVCTQLKSSQNRLQKRNEKKENEDLRWSWLFSRVLHDSTPHFVSTSIGPSIHWSIHPSHFTFLGFCGFWLHCSCPNDLVTSITAPAYPHATGLAKYLTLFDQMRLKLTEILTRSCIWVKQRVTRGHHLVGCFIPI